MSDQAQQDIDQTLEDYRELVNTLAVERWGSLEVSTEGFKEVCTKIIEAIRKLIRALIAAVDNVTSSGRIALTSQRQWLLILRDRSRTQLSLGGKGTSFTLSNNLSGICIGYRPTKTISNQIVGLRNLVRTTNKYFDWATRTLFPEADLFATLLGTLTDRGPIERKSDLIGHLRKASPLSLREQLSLRPFAGKDNVLASEPLLGNRRIFVSGPPSPEGYSDYNRLSVKMGHSDPNPQTLPPRVVYARFGISLANQAYSGVEELLNTAERGLSSDVIGKRTSILKQLEANAEKLTNRLSNSGDESLATELRGLEQGVRATADWLTGALDATINHALMVSNATLHLAQANLSSKE